MFADGGRQEGPGPGVGVRAGETGMNGLGTVGTAGTAGWRSRTMRRL